MASINSVNDIDNFRTALSLRNRFGGSDIFDEALVKAIELGEQVNWGDVLVSMSTEYCELAKKRAYDRFWSEANKLCR